MSIINSVRGSVTGAINFVVDKNRKISLISKVKHVIREEENRANEAYIALGKYYYHNLRDEDNNETAYYCAEVDHAERRLQRAEQKLEELTQCQSEIYNFDDAEFEAFCQACEAEGCEGCEGCRPIPAPQGEWDFIDGEGAEDAPEESGMDVELPPQVQQAMDEQKGEPSPSEWSTLLDDEDKQ